MKNNLIFLILSAISISLQKFIKLDIHHKKIHDIMIVGGGPGGVYTAMKLKLKYPTQNIILFERAKFLGGRLFSVSPPNSKMQLELGGMRIASRNYKVLNLVSFMQSLNYSLPLIPFPFDVPTNPAYLRENHLTNQEKVNFTIMNKIYNFDSSINQTIFENFIKTLA